MQSKKAPRFSGGDADVYKTGFSCILSHMRLFSCVLQNPLFDGVPEEAAAALLTRAGPPLAFAHGEALLGAPAPPAALGFMVSGSALVYKPAGHASRLLMSRLLPGDAFGMAALLGGERPYPTEIIAESACRALFIPKEAMVEAMLCTPALSIRYIALLESRIGFLTRRLETLIPPDLRERVLQILADFAKPPGAASPETVLPFSLSQLAEMLGTSRASLYRALSSLEAEGRLCREGRRFTICDEK